MTARLALALVASSTLGACDDGLDTRATTAFGVSPGDVESVWLSHLGDGAGRTAATCARGAADPIARALCASPAPSIGGLAELYAALGLAPEGGDLVAVATHSLGLSARTVSAVNPRVVVFSRYSPLDPNRIAAVAFARGEPFAELVGFDPLTQDFNFYLLAFQPSCRLRNVAVAGDDSDSVAPAACTAADLFTERIEDGWRGWSLYADADLEDTPLDCTSCHRPDGANAPHRLLMRQVTGPWMHWGDFRGVAADEPLLCTTADGSSIRYDGPIPADGGQALLRIDGPAGRHAAIPVATLVDAPSGYDLSSFLYYAAGFADGPGDVPCLPPDCAYSEPLPFPSQEILCDRLRDGRANGDGGAWSRYRAATQARGLPVPYFAPDILTDTTRNRVAGDFAAFVTGAASPAIPDPRRPHEQGDAFTALADLVDPAVARAIGFVADPADTAPVLLGKLCLRCHGHDTDPRLARARFDATALDELDGATAAEIGTRISLARDAPGLMPPLRSAELPDWVVQRIAAYVANVASATAAAPP